MTTSVLFLVLTGLLGGEQLSKYVVLVIIDGARYSETLGDSTAQYIPRMKSIADSGVVVDSFINNGITYTNKAVPAIWTGSWVTPRDTTVTMTSFGTINTQYTLTPSVWEYYRKFYSVNYTQAVYCMKNLSTPWLPSFQTEYGPDYWPWYILDGSNDREVWASAESKLQEYHPVLSVIYLADVDYAAHHKEWSDYLDAISIADSIVGVLWNFLQTDRYFKGNTTLLVTNDHGRHLNGVWPGPIGSGSHGDGCWGCRHVMLLGIGLAVKSGGGHIQTPYNLTDITPTIGTILDFATPYAAGRSMTDILQIPEGVATTASPHSFSVGVLNYPNPFNPSTLITYQLSGAGFVNLAVYDLTGRLVETLVAGKQPAGTNSVIWDGRNQPAGVYFYHLQTENSVASGKCLLLK
ncbi:MAG: T9SS type A sorting domain-containing protein [Candidatus Neomarinimicrobiota bacterium]